VLVLFGGSSSATAWRRLQARRRGDEPTRGARRRGDSFVDGRELVPDGVDAVKLIKGDFGGAERGYCCSIFIFSG
jgi:hypothetical protein